MNNEHELTSILIGSFIPNCITYVFLFAHLKHSPLFDDYLLHVTMVDTDAFKVTKRYIYYNY